MLNIADSTSALTCCAVLCVQLPTYQIALCSVLGDTAFSQRISEVDFQANLSMKTCVRIMLVLTNLKA